MQQTVQKFAKSFSLCNSSLAVIQTLHNHHFSPSNETTFHFLSPLCAFSADGFDIVVNDCYAHNGGNKKIQLIDQYGCPVDDKLISRFRGSWSESGLFETQVFAYMKTFRFTGSPALYIECDVRMCHGRCPVSYASTRVPLRNDTWHEALLQRVPFSSPEHGIRLWVTSSWEWGKITDRNLFSYTLERTFESWAHSGNKSLTFHHTRWKMSVYFRRLAIYWHFQIEHQYFISTSR